MDERKVVVGIRRGDGAATYIPYGPVEETEQAAAEAAVRLLLDGLGVESLTELKRLVGLGRHIDAEAIKRGFLKLKIQVGSGDRYIGASWEE